MLLPMSTLNYTVPILAILIASTNKIQFMNYNFYLNSLVKLKFQFYYLETIPIKFLNFNLYITFGPKLLAKGFNKIKASGVEYKLSKLKTPFLI